MLKVGLVGLPNVGKSSFFNLLTHAQARVDLYPFTTIEKNVGTVTVPDERLKTISEILKPPKVTPATIEFIDIAGLVKGAHQGEGLGNKFLSHIREVNLILHIVRNFEDETIPHIYNTIDPIRDLKIVESELALADLEIIYRQIDKQKKELHTAEDKHRLGVLEYLKNNLIKEFSTLKLEMSDYELVKDLNLFALKPVIYALNCSDKNKPDPNLLRSFGNKNVYLFSASLEYALEGFDETDKVEMRQSLGLSPQGPAGIVEECFKQLDLIRFYTIKGEESRAWAIKRGTNIVDAARKIHSDMAEGFIKAEVLQFDDLVSAGNFSKAKELGKVLIEGKNYIVKDGDIILIKFATH
ncbi:MAG: redox-regulated ATPase YchF [candidate division WOR-3 bacterium]|nr:redox-regulated ATPase YchF [candidate division WOR-3 bacterium]